MNKYVIFLICMAISVTCYAQIFHDRSLINQPSVEMLEKRQLDIRISHRFGDIAGNSGGWPSFYGLETAADIKIGVQYGLGKYMNVGLNRTKGVGPLKQLINTEAKIRLLNQHSEKKHPFTLVLYGEVNISTMEKTEVEGSLSNFEKFNHRMMYGGELLIAREFTHWLAIQFHAGVSHRNLAFVSDSHDIAHIGLSSKFQITKVLGVLLEGDYPFVNDDVVHSITPNLGLGIEWYTGGHTFMLKFTNGSALSLNDQVFYTRSKWEDGEFRLGFTISRLFKL